MKYSSFILDNKYRAQSEKSLISEDAENVEYFETFEELEASESYQNYIAAQEEDKKKVAYDQLSKVVKQKQYELGCDSTKETLLLIALETRGYDNLPGKVKTAFDWFSAFWRDYYYTLPEPYILDFSEAKALEISFAELQQELGY